MKNGSITVRSMSVGDSDMDGALRLSQAVLWPYRRDDWALAIGIGNGLLAWEGDSIVGSALWWNYGDALATCGIIIVSPDRQGRGLGRTLMRGVLDAIGERAVVLNSTREGRRLYEGFGFTDIGTVHQHQGQASSAAAQPMEAHDARLRRIAPSDLPAIIDMDQRAFGAERRQLIETFGLCGTGAAIERNGAIQGFAFCRRFGLGHAIGPIVTQTQQDARILIVHFMNVMAGAFLRIDVTGDSGLGEWLAAQGLAEVGTVTTMIRGQRPSPEGPHQIFALASQSFG